MSDQSHSETEESFFAWLGPRLSDMSAETRIPLGYLAPRDATPLTPAQVTAYSNPILDLRAKGFLTLAYLTIGKLAKIRRPLSPRIVRSSVLLIPVKSPRIHLLRYVF